MYNMALAVLAVAFVFFGLASANDPECARSNAINGQPGRCVTVESCPYGYYVSGLCPSYGDEVVCCYNCHYGGCQTNSTAGAAAGTWTQTGEGTSPYAAVRATWLSRYDHANTHAETAVTFATLKAKGINRVYLNVWADGSIYFNSPTFQSLGIRGFERDVLGWAVEEGRRTGIEVWAWFEYGLMTTWGSIPTATVFSNKVYSLGWVKGEAKGYWWMDAGNEEVLDFLAGMMQDAIDNYPGLAGVQLDDHFSQPHQLGDDLVATMNYAARHILDQVSGNVSLSPASPPRSSLLNFNVDWASWAKQEYGFYEYVPQIYHDLASSFDYDLTQIIAEVGKSKLVPGIRCIGSGLHTGYDVLSQMMSRCETEGIGYSVWYSRCFTQLYPDHTVG